MSRGRELRTLKANLMSDLVSLCKFFKKIRLQNPERIRSEFRRLRLVERSYYELFSEIRKYNAKVEDPREEIPIQDKERFLALFDTAKTAYYTFKVDFEHWRESRVANSSVMSNIPLPQFNGSVDGWVEFKTVFDAMVHSNTSLTFEEKFQYLKLNVKGEAYSVIREYTRDAGNYLTAYRALINRYDTPRRWIHFYVQQILKYKQTPNLNRIRFLNIHDAAFSTLKSMNIRDLADYILFHLAYNNLDSSTQHSFDLAQEDAHGIPQTHDLLEFIRSLPKGDEVHQNVQSVAAGQPTRGLPLTRKPQKFRCTFCNNNHFLAYCPIFRRRSIFEKVEFVRKRKLCTNCLGYHLLKDCLSSKTCWYCKRKHHSLLHNDPRLPSQGQDDQSTSSNVLMNRQRNSSVILAVATALRKSAREFQQIRALIGPASEATLEAVVRRLKLARRNSTTSVNGGGDAEITRTRRLVLLHFKSIYGSKANIVHALILRKLSKHIARPISPRNLYVHNRNWAGQNLNSFGRNQLIQKNGILRIRVSLRIPRYTSSLINRNQLILSHSKLIKKNGSLRINLSLRMPQYASLVSFKVVLDWCTVKIETCPGYACVTVALESGTVQIKTFPTYVVFTVIHPNGDLYNFLSYRPQISLKW